MSDHRFSPASDDGFWQQPAVTGMGAPSIEDWLARLRSGLASCELSGREILNRNPLESLLALVFGGAALYYLAERGKNEKVRHYWDALEYTSTCASVGYTNIFPETPLGKIIASILFLIGPNLAARALDPVSEKSPDAAHPTEALRSRLDAILDELRRLNAGTA
jgi:hypothetical protein